MGEENANYTFYGENLDPYDEDEIRKKPIPIEDQIVLDKNGKQRFHGDQEEFGIAPKVLRARQEFGGVSRETTRVHGDTLGEAKLLQAATERVGETILGKQEWRHGEGIGPKVSQQEKAERKAKVRFINK